jgi:hypothetical protein
VVIFCLAQVALPAWRQLSSLCALLAAAARAAAFNGMDAAALAFAVAPALSRPDGSAFMAVRHLEGLPALRRLLTVRHTARTCLFGAPVLFYNLRRLFTFLIPLPYTHALMSINATTRSCSSSTTATCSPKPRAHLLPRPR